MVSKIAKSFGYNAVKIWLGVFSVKFKKLVVNFCLTGKISLLKFDRKFDWWLERFFWKLGKLVENFLEIWRKLIINLTGGLIPPITILLSILPVTILPLPGPTPGDLQFFSHLALYSPPPGTQKETIRCFVYKTTITILISVQ